MNPRCTGRSLNGNCRNVRTNNRKHLVWKAIAATSARTTESTLYTCIMWPNKQSLSAIAATSARTTESTLYTCIMWPNKQSLSAIAATSARTSHGKYSHAFLRTGINLILNTENSELGRGTWRGMGGPVWIRHWFFILITYYGQLPRGNLVRWRRPGVSSWRVYV